MKIQIFLFLFLSLFTRSLLANPNPIDDTRICEHIKILASDEYKGRQIATIGEEKTIQYISKQFEEIGLSKPVAGSYLQKVELAKYNVKAPATIQLTDGKQQNELKHKDDFLLSSTYSKESIEIEDAELVFAGFGIHAPELGWDDYKDVDVNGKIVVVLADVPSEYTEDSTLWKGDPAANLYSKPFYKKNEAASRGAIGLLTIFKKSKQGFYTWNSIANYVGVDDLTIKRSTDATQLQFSGVLSTDATGKLFELAGKTDIDFKQQALLPDFKPYSLKNKASFTLGNTWEDITTHNVVGLLKGSDLADEVMIYTAHWDHVGEIPDQTEGDNIRNGAVDNASGTAALIEMARAFKKAGNNRRSILFIATGAEESGLLGAIWYNAHPLFPLGKTAANFNMDSHYPYGKASHVTAVVYGRSDLDKYLEESARLQNRILTPNTVQNIAADIFFRSDHFPFAEVGVPAEFAVGYGEAVGHDNEVYQKKLEAYQYKYHQPSDEYEDDFDCSGIAQDAEFFMVAGQLLDREGAFPMWYANQPFDRYRRCARYETDYFKDVTESHTPLISTQGRTMDAKPADLDGDGDMDLVITGEYSYNILLINDGTGKMADETLKRLPLKKHDSEDIALADFDQDGDIDLLIVSEDDRMNEYYLNDGKGYFEDHSHRLPVKGKSNAAYAADLNQDDFPDLIIGNAGINFCLINDQKGGWINSPNRIPSSIKTTQDIELGDVDGDGDLDILCGNEDDNEIWINDGKGYFKEDTKQRITLLAGAWETREIDLGDIDGDGDLDILMSNVNFKGNKDAQNRLFLNDGNGKFTDVTSTHLPLEKMHSADGDFTDIDADGDLDIVTGNGFGNSIACYLNNGSGQYTNATDLIFPASIKGDIIDIEVTDFNGDGRSDVYLCNFRGSDLLLFGKKK